MRLFLQKKGSSLLGKINVSHRQYPTMVYAPHSGRAPPIARTQSTLRLHPPRDLCHAGGLLTPLTPHRHLRYTSEREGTSRPAAECAWEMAEGVIYP